MKDSIHSNSHQSGVTLVELLVVIVVISVIAGFAMIQRGSANAQLTRQNAAQQLKTAFERARFDSVKRRPNEGNPDAEAHAKVIVTPTSFTLRRYNNDANGVPGAVNVVTTLPAGVVIALYDGTPLTTRDVSFNMRGETAASPAAQFRVCNVSCASPANSNANIVIVTPTGTVNLLSGGSTLPTFGAPAVTPVSNSAGINPDAVL